MKGRMYFILLVICLVIMTADSARASILINEIFSDPAAGLTGDANGDGIRSGTQDEFVELVNVSSGVINISGWKLNDSVSTRHIFPSNTILNPDAFLSIFGGGSPVKPDINWQVASSGSLGLNNGGDSVLLFNADDQLIDQVVYGSIGGKNQSFTRSPDGTESEFILHSELVDAQGALFSPGTTVDSRFLLASLEEDLPEDNNFPENPVVPELPTFIYFALGWGSIFLRKIRVA